MRAVAGLAAAYGAGAGAGGGGGAGAGAGAGATKLLNGALAGSMETTAAGTGCDDNPCGAITGADGGSPPPGYVSITTPSSVRSSRSTSATTSSKSYMADTTAEGVHDSSGEVAQQAESTRNGGPSAAPHRCTGQRDWPPRRPRLAPSAALRAHQHLCRPRMAHVRAIGQSAHDPPS